MNRSPPKDIPVWEYHGQKRPPFAPAPEAGQESVWDYPRPPAIEIDSRPVVVRLRGVTLADSSHARRILETASPPTFYLPPRDVRVDLLVPNAGRSVCEWKGVTRYWSAMVGDASLWQVAWSYPHPTPPFEAIAGYFSFYPARVECYVDDERVQPQPGGFYGGWVTREIVGPFKGLPGTEHW